MAQLIISNFDVGQRAHIAALVQRPEHAETRLQPGGGPFADRKAVIGGRNAVGAWQIAEAGP